MKNHASPHGTWFCLRKVGTCTDIWVNKSVYVPPHYDTPDLQQALHDHYNSLPATALAVLVGGDVNGNIKWSHDVEGAVQSFSTETKGRVTLDHLESKGFSMAPPFPDQVHRPTSRPRKQGVNGRKIDWIAMKRTQVGA